MEEEKIVKKMVCNRADGRCQIIFEEQNQPTKPIGSNICQINLLENVDFSHWEWVQSIYPRSSTFEVTALFGIDGCDIKKNLLEKSLLVDTFLVLEIFLLLFCICSALFVILLVNTIHAVFFLIVLFLNASFLLILEGNDFLGLIYLVVYVGAIATVFIFTIFLVNVRKLEMEYSENKKVSTAGILFCAILILFSLITWRMGFIRKDSIQMYTGEAELTSWVDLLEEQSQIRVIGSVLFNYFSEAFVLSGILLLIAMLGPIALTLTYRLNSKRQALYLQINKKFTHRLVSK